MSREKKHPKSCDCAVCAWERAMEVVAKARGLGINVLDPKATVMVRKYTVRAHARRNSRHLSAYPNTRKLLEKELRGKKR